MKTKDYHPRCTICAHPERARIELAMANNVGKRATAKRFSVSEDAVYRHFHRHTPDSVKLARKTEFLRPGAELDKLVVEEGTGLLDTLRLVRAGLLRQLDLALGHDDRPGVASMAHAIHKNTELIGKYTGELTEARKVSDHHVILSEDYLTLRARIIAALRPFPEALAAVTAAFSDTEAKSTLMIEGKAL